MPFSKHLVLRVQVAHATSLGDAGKLSKRSKRSLKPGEVADEDEWKDGKDGSAKDRDGPYRIVQVPANYTFKHLHKLLLFLFDLPARSAVSSPSKSKLSDDDDLSHLFEVQKSIVTHSAKPFSQPGHIKSGKTWAKLSSVRDPYARNISLQDAYDAPEDEDADGIFDDEEEESGEWSWENEDDFALGNVWPKGADQRRGIIYVSPLPLSLTLHL
ncbi:hypothetical protein JAAARDRAFT_591811 [Jaapia argillacea MUCL 33604]|uniref:Uncharacterized protein n=1 Tax=Jaapia argillacea MUCL 33604 TaxID=933084 RepID=A0A067Q1G9_9AGAM|nr:hypothetical protein JAAARDRAFT_591811 [Jaapia argillacea MUCL 33604]